MVDDEASAVVKRILQLTMEDNGPYRISIILEEEQVEIPGFNLAKMVQFCTNTRSLKTCSDGIAPHFVLSSKSGNTQGIRWTSSPAKAGTRTRGTAISPKANGFFSRIPTKLSSIYE